MRISKTTNEATVTVHIPMTFIVRGGRKTIISEATVAPPQPRIDNALLKALARAHRWRAMVEDGKFASITELAKTEGINESYACRLLRLTLLSPAIIVEALNGRQTSGLMLKDVLRPLPARWDEQSRVLSFSHSRSA